MIKRLTPTYPVHARNFTQFEAQQRLFALAETTKERQRNSIFVHGTSCIYYQKIPHGVTCTCRNKELVKKTPTSDGGEIQVAETAEQVTSPSGTNIEIDFRDPLFGTVEDDANDMLDIMKMDTVDLEVVEEEDINGTDLFGKSLFSDSIDCGVCYRSGHLPGYVPLGHSRYLFHTHNVSDMLGYTVDQSTYPTTFSLQSDGGVVVFDLAVPTIFHDVTYGVFNNNELLNVQVRDLTGQPMTKAFLNSNLGSNIQFQVEDVGTFTHVVFQFRIVETPIFIDFPQNQRNLDLSMFDTVGNVTLVTSDTVPSVNSGDVVFNMENGSLWKITDYEYFRLKDGNVLGWNLTARILQPDETLIRINTMFSLT